MRMREIKILYNFCTLSSGKSNLWLKKKKKEKKKDFFSKCKAHYLHGSQNSDITVKKVFFSESLRFLRVNLPHLVTNC